MNVSTRYADGETVRLLCGVPEAIESPAAFARQVEGVAIGKQGETGIDILEALISVSALKTMALPKNSSQCGSGSHPGTWGSSLPLRGHAVA
jgi:hypothetical protein